MAIIIDAGNIFIDARKARDKNKALIAFNNALQDVNVLSSEKEAILSLYKVKKANDLSIEQISEITDKIKNEWIQPKIKNARIKSINIKVEEDGKHKKALAFYHIAIKKAGVNEYEKEALLSGYGVCETKELTTAQLYDIGSKLNEQSKTVYVKGSLESWIGSTKKIVKEYCKKQSYETNNAYIEQIICTAAKAKTIKEINLETLKSIYYKFKRK